MAKKRIFIYIFPAYLLIIVLSIAAITWLFSKVMYESYKDMVKEKLESSAYSMRPMIKEKLESGGEDLNKSLKELAEETKLRITIIDSDGVVLAESSRNAENMENHANRPEIHSAIEGVPAFSTRYSATLTKDTMYLAVPIMSKGKTIAVLRTAVTLNSLDRALSSTYTNIITFGFLVAVIAVGIAYLIARKLSAPLEELKNNASILAKGDFSFKPFRSNITEIDELSASMSIMSDSLQSQIKEIREQKNELKLILGNMREGVIAVDLNDNIIILNSAAKQILNTSSPAMESSADNDSSADRTFIETGSTEASNALHSFKETVRIEALHKFVADLFKEKKFLHRNIELIDLQTKIIDVHGAVLNDQLGEPIGVLLVINDITQISQLEKMRKNFAANVSHELKTPLTAIKGAVETLQEGAAESPEDSAKFLKIIEKHSDRLAALINDTMSLSRIEQETEDQSLQKTIVKLVEIISTATDLCREKAETRKIAFKIDCPDEIKIEVNSQMLEQALVNLIDNAIKFSPENDTVTISAGASAKFVTIRVTDHGCGIPEKHIPHLFERFYRVDKGRSRQNGGTGLGLAIVKHIAQSHEGTVGVESIPGTETTFSIKLPI